MIWHLIHIIHHIIRIRFVKLINIGYNETKIKNLLFLFLFQGATALPQHDQYSTHPHPHSHMALHNVTLAELGSNQSTLPPGSMGPTIPLTSQQSHYATPNLGTAVSSSMHLTNSSHESDVGATSGYKMDHDMMYYTV